MAVLKNKEANNWRRSGANIDMRQLELIHCRYVKCYNHFEEVLWFLIKWNITYCMTQLSHTKVFAKMKWGFPDSSLVKNPPATQETPIRFLGWEDCWRRDRLPTPVYLGFPCDSAGKESACSAGDQREMKTDISLHVNLYVNVCNSPKPGNNPDALSMVFG